MNAAKTTVRLRKTGEFWHAILETYGVCPTCYHTYINEGDTVAKGRDRLAVIGMVRSRIPDAEIIREL